MALQRSAAGDKPDGTPARETGRVDAGALLEGTVTDAMIRDRFAGMANAPATPPILVEIDQAVTGGQAHDRFDIMLRGRAVSVAPIEEVRLLVGDLVVSTASYGLPEQAAPGILPDGRAARQRVFHFSLPRSAGPRQEGIGLRIVARTEDGCVGCFRPGRLRHPGGRCPPPCRDVYRARLAHR